MEMGVMAARPRSGSRICGRDGSDRFRTAERVPQ